MPKRLLVLSGPDEGRVFPIPVSDSLLLGRSRATDTRLIDPHVSRVHCQVQMELDKVMITDFDSAGGTLVNGQRVTGKQVLNTGDMIRIGNTRLQYLEDEEEVLAETVPLAIPVKPTAPAGTWADAMVGQKLSNYKIGSILARGRTGYVFHARDVRKNLPVALKILNPEVVKTTKEVQRFVQAMKTALPLRHPNLATIYGAGRTGQHCWIAMEYVTGESLAAVVGRIETAGMLDWRQVLRLAIFLLRALDFVHKKNIIHRHINPNNILLGKGPSDTKISDLMLATAVGETAASGLNRKDGFMADIPYLPPEGTVPQMPMDARSDLYSLGATLYAMFSGQPPFKGESVTELVTKIRRENPIPLKDLFLGIPEKLENAVLKMLAKRPPDRYQSAQEILGELEGFAKEKGVTIV